MYICIYVYMYIYIYIYIYIYKFPFLTSAFLSNILMFGIKFYDANMLNLIKKRVNLRESVESRESGNVN